MVTIDDYRERWPSEFQTLADNLRLALGERALRIDHIGSTSVPGLPAKDVIDIQITVAALEEALVSAMQTAGYVRSEGIRRDHCPPDRIEQASDWEKLLFGPPPGTRRTNIHIRVEGRPNQRFALLFRDYLRTHPATAAAYAELKRRLAQNLADPRTYPDVKDPAVDLIYFAAEEWATITHWEPGASDG